MRKKVFYLPILLGFFVIAMFLSGCVTVMNEDNLTSGRYYWTSGRLIKEFDVKLENVSRSVDKAAAQLGLSIVKNPKGYTRAEWRGDFPDGKSYSVEIISQSDVSTSMVVGVGLFGDRLRSEMILNAVQRNL